MDPQAKYEALLQRIAETESMLVAYSGGVDSTLLAFAAHAVLGERCLAVLAASDLTSESEIQSARHTAATLGLNLLEVETNELSDPRFVENTPERCYHCKGELLGLLARVAEARGLAVVADGGNVDDLDDYRPGAVARDECGAISPLQEVGMNKADIRFIASELGLPNWNKPAMACLASRIPYGTPITDEALSRIARAETSVAALGFERVRVRSHGDLARLEFDPAEQNRAWALRDRIAADVRAAGFTWVAQDLQGYRTGALNETLAPTDALPTEDGELGKPAAGGQS